MNILKNIMISFRRFRSEKVNTLISISGLVLALSIVTIVLVFIINELNYNSFFKNKDRVYRVLNYDKKQNKYWATSPYQIGEIVKEEISGVEAYARQYNVSRAKFYKSKEWISEKYVLSTDSSFFQLFGIDILQGNLKGFQDDEHKIILSSQTVKKYFGKENPIGKNLKMSLNGVEYDMQIAAVFENIPNNTSIRADLIVNPEIGFKALGKSLISFGGENKKEFKNAWDGVFFTNYILIKKSVSRENVESKIKKIGKEVSSQRFSFDFSIQSLQDVYFNSKGIIDNQRIASGNLGILYVLGSIGLLILIIACINYLNLASAQAITHLKNFAVRKTYGASQKDIFRQLIFDYCLQAIIALPFAVGFAQFVLPLFSQMLGKNYQLEINSDFIVGFIILVILTLLTGFITAIITFYKFRKSELTVVLKGNKKALQTGFTPQKGMIVFQIVVFIVLLSATIVIQKQVRYSFSKDLGFTKEGLLNLSIGDKNKEVLYEKLSAIPNVKYTSAACWLPQTNNKMYMSMPRVDRPDEDASVIGLYVDYNFVKTLDFNLLRGSDFERNKQKRGVIVNQSAIKELGLTDVIGEELFHNSRIIGLVEDFHMYSMKEQIPPMVICLQETGHRYLSIRISTKDFYHTIDQIEQVWNETEGNTPFDPKFMEDSLNQLYQSEIRFSKIIGSLSVIAILIASMGLLGLSLFVGKQRIKEIGVRKTNGAKTIEIVRMLNRDYLKLVLIAFVIALPVVWFIMNKWLQTFVYRTNLSWWIFIVAGMAAMFITLLTVSLQSWSAARRNPIESLRYE
jgi:putative ABC transport system permease protein